MIVPKNYIKTIATHKDVHLSFIYFAVFSKEKIKNKTGKFFLLLNYAHKNRF